MPHKNRKFKAAFTHISQYELDRFYGETRKEAQCRDASAPLFNRMANKMFFCVMQHVNSVAKEHGVEAASKVVTDMVQQARGVHARCQGITKMKGPRPSET